jgi:hypothetical protein
MLRRNWILGALCALATAASAQAPSVEVGGVAFPTTASVAGSNLQLNGAGVRYKFVVKVYSAGLYLTAKSPTTEQVIAAPGPKRMQITMLRDIDANELGKLFTKGIQDNVSKEDFSKSIPGTIKMSEIFSTRKKLEKGETFSVDWVPGQGTVIVLNGKPQGEPIKEPEFYGSMMKIWLGSSPADAQLKEALLGKTAQ